MRKQRLLPLLLASWLLGGCASILATSEGWPEPIFYGGVRFDWHLLGGYGLPTGPCEPGTMGAVFATIDLPLSFVMDTALLPLHGVLYLAE